jgi:hypothetical protein
MSNRVQTSVAWVITFGLCAVMLASATWELQWVLHPLAMK